MSPAQRPLNNLERLHAWQALASESRTFIPPEPITTGLAGVDKALGGGLDRGQIYEVFGAESSGKTSLALFLSRSVHEKGGLCAWIDADHSLDAGYPAQWGIDADRMWVSEASSLEQGFGIIERLGLCGAIDWIVLDSLTALPLEIERMGRISEDYLIERDEFLRQALPRLYQILHRTRTTLLIVSQTRHRSGHIYQSEQASTASLALKLRATARFELVNQGFIKEERQIIGHKIQIRIVKHHSATIFSTNNVDIMYNLDTNKIKRMDGC